MSSHLSKRPLASGIVRSIVRHALLEDALTLALWWSSVRWVDQLTGTWWLRENVSKSENAKGERVGHSKHEKDRDSQREGERERE